MATPEQRARQNIDRMLEQAGWDVQGLKDVNFGASRGVAVREFPLKAGIADYMHFVDRSAVGVVEAKKEGTSLGGVDTQSGNQEEGFNETFLGENRWYKVRLHSSMIPKIKHIAAYQIAPVSAITYVAPVESVEPWQESGKYVLNFSEPATKLPQPVKLVPKG